MKFKLAFIGFGVVGQGLAEILVEKDFHKNYDFDHEVVAISDMKLGSIYDPEGLDMRKVLDIVEKGENLDQYPADETGWDPIETIEKSNANTVIEVTYTDMETGGPALDHVRTALKKGKHVVSTNKGPVANEANELLELAEKKGVHYKFEGTVLSGTPAINLALMTLNGCEIKEIKGIVNGTTNYILTKMEEGMEYEEALKKAQELGYAEADPTGDVEGIDAQGKIEILSNTVMGADIELEDVSREGITKLTLSDIREAKEEGYRWKLVGSTKKSESGVEAKVSPEKLPLDHPLANVMGPTNALTYTTDYLDEVTIIGPGAGKKETGFALLVDLLFINKMEN
ncbi:MAG: homoserine dehydrogenase [Candidatus Saliniplasma sp.]